MPVRGLTVVVTKPTGFRAALELATANAALGGRARVFCQSEAVTALCPLPDTQDDRYAACGLPTMAQLFEDAIGLDVEIIACQSGLALMAVDADALDARVTFGGPVSILQTLAEDRLTTL